MGYVRPYELGDELWLADHLREADKQEMLALSNEPFADRLRQGGVVSMPSCTVIDNDGHVAAMFGVAPEHQFGGRVWLIGTEKLVQNPLRRQFLKECKGYLGGMSRHYRYLFNLIDERNVVHVRWLQWLGFKFVSRRAYGIKGLPFLEFIKPCVNQ